MTKMTKMMRKMLMIFMILLRRQHVCIQHLPGDPSPLVLNVGPWYRGTFLYISYIVGSGGVINGFLDIFINNKLCMFRICLSAAFYAHLDEGVLGLVWIR